MRAPVSSSSHVADAWTAAELQESLSSAAQAKRVGEAKVIAARAEVDAARLMREAADMYVPSRSLLGHR